MSFDEFKEMEFYEQKLYDKEILKKRFENTKKYFNFTEVGGLTKFIDSIMGLFSILIVNDS